VKTPTYEEALWMAQLKRERAKEAMSQIVQRFGVISHEPFPSLDVLLEYFVNMVYAIELLMKVLADDWQVSNKSKFRHYVGKMYKEIFGKDYTKSDLMDILESAINDQKFIYEPSGVLAERVPELEELWDELKSEYYKRNFNKLQTLEKAIEMPSSFGQYLVNNIERFYVQKSVVMDRTPKAEKIQMLELEIQYLQDQIERLKNSPEEPPDVRKQFDALHQELAEKISGFRSCMTWNLASWGKLSFGRWMGRAVVSDFLG
jgi:hypothetical protein